MKLPAFTEQDATFSPCRTWRYRLWRVWDNSLPPLAMGMLNPSDANEEVLDATVKRQVRRAVLRRFGSLIVFNAYAVVEKYPPKMKARLAEGFDIVGPENDLHTRAIISEVGNRAGTVAVGWGADGDIAGRGKAITAMARALGVQLFCVGTTRDGQPRHPLYVPYSQDFIPWGAL